MDVILVANEVVNNLIFWDTDGVLCALDMRKLIIMLVGDLLIISSENGL